MPHVQTLLMLFFVLFLVSCAPAVTPPAEPPFIEELASPLPTIAILEATIPGYPPPVTIEPPSTFVPFPTDIPPAPPVGSELTPFPTLTPPPTPTHIPGPTSTPLAIPPTASSAAGNIIYTVHETNDTMGIYTLAVDGAGMPTGSPVKLSNETFAPPWGTMTMHPSPDGSRIVLVDNSWGGRVIFYPETGDFFPLFREKIDPLGLFFNWHPNSRQILIRADDGSREVGLWLVDVDDGEHVVLLQDFPSPHFQGGTISPDGQKVVYSVQIDFTDPGEVWLMNLDGSEARQVYNNAAFSMSWSPDGSKIAFISGGLMVMDADGSNPRILIQNIASDYDSTGFAWSPDSQTIAVVTTDSIGSSKQTILLIDVETGEEHPLLVDDNWEYIDPVWSPDGTQIAFTLTADNKSELWAVNVDGSNLRQLVFTDQNTGFPFWHALPNPQ